MESVPRFYVYVLTRPDGAPFYVGKGQGRRIQHHAYEARRGCTCHKCCVIRSIWRSGDDFQWNIVFRTDDEAAAFMHERALIARYGRDRLCNLTDGGDGASGAVRSAKTRKLMSDAAKRRMRTPEMRARMSAVGRMRTLSEEQKRAIGNLKRGHVKSAETRQKVSKALKGRSLSAEHRAKIAEAHKGIGHSEEARAKIGQASAMRRHSEESRQRMSAAHQGKKFTPEHRAKIAEANRRRWAKKANSDDR